MEENRFAPWVLPLIGAAVGLMRACDKQGFSPESDRLFLEALRADETNAETVIGKLHAEKTRVVPDCMRCQNPCGAVADPEMQAVLDADEPDARRERAAIWARLQETERPDTMAFRRAVFSFGEHWPLSLLREVRYALEQENGNTQNGEENEYGCF